MANIPLGGIPKTAPATPPAAQAQPTTPFRQSVPAAAPPVANEPAVPAPPAAPVGLEVQFNHEKITLPMADAQKYAQIGLKAHKLEQRQRQLEDQARQQENYLKAGRLLEEVAQRDPRAYEVIKGAIAGQYPAPASAASESDDDEGLTKPHQPDSYTRELEQRLLRLESANNQIAQSFHQKEYSARLESALNRPYLRANPEAEELARVLVPALADAFDGDLDQAAIVAESRAKKLVEGHMQREREEREAKRETAPMNSLNGGPPLPRLDPQAATYAAHKSGQGRAAMRDLLAKWKAAVSGPQT